MFPKAPPVIGADWITTPPLAEDSFRGRVSVLLFWSIGCEASRVRLLELDALSHRVRHSINVVAVHSPRFAYERDGSAVADTVARLGIRTPVVHDAELLTWARYDPGGWPTTILVDSRGRAIGAARGLEGLEPLVEAAEMALLRAERAALSDRRSWRRTHTPVELSDPVLPSDVPPPSGLAWPSGLAVLPAEGAGNERLVVVDSGHDRLLVLAPDRSQRSATLTGGFEGLTGVHGVCARPAEPGRSPQLAASIPDLGKVVQLDLGSGSLRTVGDEFERPTGLAVDRDGSVVVADAGDNQLVRILPGGEMGVVAGSGFSGTADGRGSRAELAQPVALCRTQTGIAFLDAASSNLRLLNDRGDVSSVTHNDFETFGLVDGAAHGASLQRPSGVATLTNGDLAITDTGNNRIRILHRRKLRTLGLTGLRRPEAIAVLRSAEGEDRLAIADTANHRVIIAAPDDRDAWELELPRLG